MPQAATLSPVISPLRGKLVECPWADCRSRGGGRFLTRVAPGYVVVTVQTPQWVSEEKCRSCHRKSYVTRRTE